MSNVVCALTFFARQSPAPLLQLQAAVLDKPKHIARNVMEGGYTGRNAKPETDLTEPQGKLKIILCCQWYRCQVPSLMSRRLRFYHLHL